MPEKQPRKKIILAIVLLFLAVVIFLSYFLLKKTATSSESKQINERTGYSIAVLPFTNKTSDSVVGYFSDGIAEGILNSLARVKGLKVSARSSSFRFRNNEENSKMVGQKLGVQNILEGNFQIAGDSIFITAQLINATNGNQIWSGQYNENAENIFGLQDKIAKAITATLAIPSLEIDDPATEKKAAISKEAYELYVKGRSYWNLRTAGDLKKAIDLFNGAIVKDSLFANAWSGIADCYTALGYGSFISPRDAFPKALEAANKALAIDSTLAGPHAALGFYKFYYEWDWAAAEQEFRTAIAQNQNYEIAYDWYGYYLTAMQRYSEAEVIFKKATELDPLSHSIKTDIGFSLYYARSYDKAINELRLSLQMKPAYGLAHLWAGRVYQEKKMYNESIDEYRKTLLAAPGWPVAYAAIGNVYGIMGETAKAKAILDTLFLFGKSKFVTAYGVALVYAGIGDKDKTFEWIDKAYDERSNWLVWLKSDPRWARINTDKRFAEVVHRVGLPD